MYADGERYEGELKEGLRDGFGRMSYRNGIVYEGGWVGNGKEGSGVERYIIMKLFVKAECFCYFVRIDFF
jgi:hypothetical protein